MKERDVIEIELNVERCLEKQNRVGLQGRPNGLLSKSIKVDGVLMDNSDPSADEESMKDVAIGCQAESDADLVKIVLCQELMDLMCSYKKLDSALLLLNKKYKGHRFAFKQLQECMESTTRWGFSQTELGKLLRLYPMACRVSCGAQDSIVYVEAYPANISSDTIDERMKSFKDGVSAHVRESYLRYVDKGKPDGPFSAEHHTLPVVPVLMPNPGKCLNEDLKTVTDKRTGYNYLPLAFNRDFRGVLDSERKRRNPEVLSDDLLILEAPTKKTRSLVGLPSSLVKKSAINGILRQKISPEAVMSRQRARIKQALPSFFDAVYLYFRSRRRSKSDFNKLATDIFEMRGSGTQCSDLTNKKHRLQLVKEQLWMLANMLPQWCNVLDSKINADSKVFHVDISDAVDINKLREKLVSRCLELK